MRASVKGRARESTWTAASTQVNMKTTSRKATVFTGGKMARVMKVSGRMEFFRVKASNISQTGLFLMECGKTDYQQELAFASTQMEAATTATGKRGSHTEWVRKPCPTGPHSTDSGSKARHVAMELKFSLMVRCLKGSGRRASFLGESASSLTAKFMKENGTKGNLRVSVSKFGLTEGDTKVPGTRGSRSARA